MSLVYTVEATTANALSFLGLVSSTAAQARNPHSYVPHHTSRYAATAGLALLSGLVDVASLCSARSPSPSLSPAPALVATKDAAARAGSWGALAARGAALRLAEILIVVATEARAAEALASILYAPLPGAEIVHAWDWTLVYGSVFVGLRGVLLAPLRAVRVAWIMHDPLPLPEDQRGTEVPPGPLAEAAELWDVARALYAHGALWNGVAWSSASAALAFIPTAMHLTDLYPGSVVGRVALACAVGTGRVICEARIQSPAKAAALAALAADTPPQPESAHNNPDAPLGERLKARLPAHFLLPSSRVLAHSVAIVGQRVWSNVWDGIW